MSETNTVEIYSQDSGANSYSNVDSNLCTLYVGNVAFEAEEKHLRDLFSKFDPKEIRVKQELTPTGNTRKFAFVNVPTLEQGKAAINELDGHSYMGRVIYITLSRSGHRDGINSDRDGGGAVRRPRGGKTSLYKTTVCRFFSEGGCSFGADCNFIHEANSGIPHISSSPRNNYVDLNYQNTFNSSSNFNNSNFNNSNFNNSNFNNNNNYNQPDNAGYNNINYNNINMNNNMYGNNGYSQGGVPRGGFGMVRGGYNSRGGFARGPTGGKAENFRTVRCKLYPLGRCSFGDGCSFIHADANSFNYNVNGSPPF